MTRAFAIGQRVRVVADNYAIGGVVVDIRAGAYPYLIATDDGQQTWYAAWEVFDV